MVHFILGRAGSGKSQEVLERVRQSANGKQNIFVVVPEQFTFETERKFYHALGAAALRNVKIISFSRIAHQVFKEYGGAAGDYADDSVKLILMSAAVEEVRSQLTAYAKSAEHGTFLQTMLEMVTELKNADLDGEAFFRHAKQLSNEKLKAKAGDISLIYSVYDAMLGAHYKDHLDDLSRAVEKIRKHGYFKDSLIFIDEFKGFTAREFSMLRVMMETAQEVTVSLCLDPAASGENQLFYCVDQTYQKLKQLARQGMQKVSVPTVLSKQHRFQSPELAHLEQQVFSSSPKAFGEECTHFKGVLAANEYDEADYVGATIRELVQEQGLRYRDIVVVSRDFQTVQSCLENAFLKYEIPYYLDTVKNIGASPLIRMIDLCLSCAGGSLKSDDLISLLKCGFCGYTAEEIALLENYVFLWDIKGDQWEKPFVNSIFGMDQPSGEEELQQHTLALLGFNKIREHLYTALASFREQVSGADAGQICTALANLLEALKVRESLNRMIEELKEDSLAEQIEQVRDHRQVWEITEEILRLITTVIGRNKLSVRRFQELFLAVAANFDLGTLPQTVDCVTAGSAERIRTDCPKALFILEANDKVFPYIPENRGLLTDKERQDLIGIGVELSAPLKDKIREEKFIAYKSLAIPSQQLFVIARKADMKGAAKAPSYLFQQFKRMFGPTAVQDTDDVDRIYFCKTKPTAFSVLAYQYRQDHELTASLREYFSHDPLYKGRMERISQSLDRSRQRLRDRETARALYGDSIYLSPSQVEKYHACKFRYFCEYGMRLRPRERIQLNGSSRGLVIHHILQAVCEQIDDYSFFDEEKIRGLVERELEAYLSDMLDGKSRSKRFLYLYRRIFRTIMLILKQLFEELSQSLFRPAEFEYRIGEPEHVRPLAIQNADGLKLYLIGTVDRIDQYEAKNGSTYLRVVDYKSGTKEFALSDLMNGVNLQMFLYLMCLEKNGQQFYRQAKGAGVLYMPAREPAADLQRGAAPEEIQKKVSQNFCMKGMVLDEEEVLRAMERDLAGRYIPVSVTKKAYDKDHRLKEEVFIDHHANEALFGSRNMNFLLSSEQLGQLYRKLERTLKQMAQEMEHGNIEAKPLRKSKELVGCAYCQFQTACGFEEGDDVTEYQSFDKSELFETLAREEQTDR